MNARSYRLRLDSLLADAEKEATLAIPPDAKRWIGKLVDSNNKAIIAVTMTSLLKKAMCPEQDVRKHQTKMRGGYSGRTLDQSVTTPFLKANAFPAMSESGWLTRSFEQNAMYTLNYPGAIRKAKKEFLSVLDLVETKGADPAPMIAYMLQLLIKKRKRQRISLAIPSNLSVKDTVEMLKKHFFYSYPSGHGASRLPVLAIHAIYVQLIAEIGRYRGCTLKKPRPHTAADSQTRSLGDVEVRAGGGYIYEAVEVKHNKPITPSMVRSAFKKFESKRGLERYYILTTRMHGNHVEGVSREIVKISRTHGCQVIVNGVIESIGYYLRLLRSTDGFVQSYVGLLERDPAVTYHHRSIWNEIAGGDTRGMALPASGESGGRGKTRRADPRRPSRHIRGKRTGK